MYNPKPNRGTLVVMRDKAVPQIGVGPFAVTRDGSMTVRTVCIGGSGPISLCAAP